MNRSNSRAKIATTNMAPVRSVLPAIGGQKGPTKKLKGDIRRVMSDRTLKMAHCSQQQNVEKVKQRASQISVTPNIQSPATIPQSTSLSSIASLTNKNDMSKSQAEISASAITGMNPNRKSPVTSPTLNTNLEEPLEINVKDKSSLEDYIKEVYEKITPSTHPLSTPVQKIMNAINTYIDENNLDPKKAINEVLKETLLKTSHQLKQKYINQDQNEFFKMEGEVQVLFQIENYIATNRQSVTNKVKVDDDLVWEIANSIRFLSQTFRDKFKIERFLFGEIYPSYHPNAPEFILSLMEELGYDKEDNSDSDDDNSSSDESQNATHNSPSSSMVNALLVTPTKSSPSKIKKITPDLNRGIQADLLHRDDSNSNFTSTTIRRVNSLFEEFDEETSKSSHHLFESNDFDDTTTGPFSSQTNAENSTESLNELRKKKLANRFTDYSSTAATRSIMVHKRKTQLKIRPSYKSPNKMTSNRQKQNGIENSNNLEQSRKSPRIKDKQILLGKDDSPSAQNRKRPRTYLVVDTPDHKQKSNLIRTRQEKIKKRFSLQSLINSSKTSTGSSTSSITTTTTTLSSSSTSFSTNSSATVANSSSINQQNTNQKIGSLPVVPDTPVKNENRHIPEPGSAKKTINFKCTELIFNPSSSPRKTFLFSSSSFNNNNNNNNNSKMHNQ